MSLIKIENLTFSYPSSFENVFENVSFQIDTRWRLGVIGRNGRGKTTFLKLLMGQYEYGGSIISSEKFEYFPYSVRNPRDTGEEVVRKLRPEIERWETERELSLMDTDLSVLDRPFCTLSGGEKTKLLLAVLFLREGAFPLIDEPTNHLDERGRQTVASYLGKKRGFMLVSHDRRFLDGCADRILSFTKTGIEVQKGNFSSWFEGFQKAQQAEELKNQRLKKDIARLNLSAERASAWSDKTEASKYGDGSVDKGYVGHKAAKLMKRSKAIEQRRIKAAEQKSELLKNAETAEDLKIFPLSHHSGTVVSFQKAAPMAGGREVCAPLTFEVKRGECVALTGPNGCGKSTALKLAAGMGGEYRGEIRLPSGLIVSYVPQDASFIKGDLSRLSAEYRADESLFKAILRKLGFKREQFEKDAADFSDGQKKKTLIALSLCQKAHLYIWDEPLNYIDIYSRMQIEKLIREFRPTMLMAEHDAAFKEAVGARNIEMEPPRD